MKRTISSLLLILIFFNSFGNVKALSAKSAVLYEPITNRILFSKNENERLPMASTTKILTAITALENCNIDEIATTSYKAATVEGSSIWLEEGEKMSIENLLYGLLLSSGNDASITIAEHISGTTEEFAKLMNITAARAGARNSNFTNPSGLDDENHYTTALDLAKITSYAMNNNTFKNIVSSRSKTIPWEGHEWNRQLKNHNKLLAFYEGANGVKTGYTKKDGRCLVGSAEKNGITLITVTLNAPDDWNDHKEMFDYGYSQLTNKNISTSYYTLKITNGTKEFTTVKSKYEFQFPVLKNDDISIKHVLPDTINPPIFNDMVVGYDEIYINNTKIHEIPIIATEEIDSKKVIEFKNYIEMIIKYFSLI